MAIIDFCDTQYSVDNKLMKMWKKNSLQYVKKINGDRVYIVDGQERIGKSLWTIQQACAIDPAMKDVNTFISRICFTPEEFDNAIRNTKNGVIIFDEAFRGFSSRAALSKTNRRLITTLMEMGQNNNIVFIVLPSFFMLDVYPAMLRSNVLFNIYLDKKTGMRTFRGYNKRDKNSIYQIGLKRGWSYPFDTRFKGRFFNKFPGGVEFERAYLNKKANALKDMRMEHEKVVEKIDRFQIQRDLMIKGMHSEYIKSYRKLSAWLKRQGIELSFQQIGKITGDTSEIAENESPVASLI